MVLDIIKGFVNFNKVADDYERNDRSYSASYYRHHVKPVVTLVTALALTCITVGTVKFAISSLSNKRTNNNGVIRGNDKGSIRHQSNSIPYKR